MTVDLPDLPDLAAWVSTESRLFASEGSPFQAAMTAGASNLLVVTGDNAAGKSLWYRVLCAKVSKAGAVPVRVSIRERAGSGTGEGNRLRQVMMFGDETEQSTGATSVQVIQKGFANLDRAQGSIFALDEPELGLSEGYTRALGTYLGQQLRSVPVSCAGLVLVTHSRPLVSALVAETGTRPTFVSVTADGTAPVADLDTWLATEEVRTVEELLGLYESGLDRWRVANHVMSGAGTEFQRRS